ncbi:hypothetical protein DYB28_007698 [Aphanomyces astaci]|uniref:Uncharacterized protein n=1 Tax=Aphanomyces astaci TaxID=112090 RepID=A0A9X8E7A2_APHAT|nr:hypothetical protein DYB28_007698 [Aphanomyces astaci]
MTGRLTMSSVAVDASSTQAFRPRNTSGPHVVSSVTQLNLTLRVITTGLASLPYGYAKCGTLWETVPTLTPAASNASMTPRVTTVTSEPESKSTSSTRTIFSNTTSSGAVAG